MKTLLKNLILILLMLAAAALSRALRPTIRVADERPAVDLSAMVPTVFGDWREETNMLAQVVNPQQQRTINKIYSQTLSRTYANKKGYRIMLSVAYGKNQSDALQLHMPEICYPSQGFVLLNKRPTKLDLLGRPSAATQIETSLGLRFEPVTYWIVVGDHITSTGTDKKFTELRYALHNRIPDGFLVRVSSIDKDTSNAYTLQSQFANAMIGAIAPEHRNRFAGESKSN